MPLTLSRRELRGAFVYFIPNGTAVDGGTVSITAWPDAAPTTNYTDWQFADIEKVEVERQTKSEDFDVPDTAGGYSTDKEEWITRRTWKCTSAKTNSLLKQLENGTSAAVAAGVPQTPLGTKANSIDGVLLIEIKGKDGTVIERTQVWARLTVSSAAGAENTTSKIAFEFQQLTSTLNTYQAN
jgi:hypothetical protein